MDDIVETLAVPPCDPQATVARDFIDNLSVDTFGMSGECDVRDNDNNQFYDRMQNGIWRGELDGTFTGERSMSQMPNP